MIVVAYGRCWWLWSVGWGGFWCSGIGVLVCLLGVARFEMKRAGDLFPNHPEERTDSVRQ